MNNRENGSWLGVMTAAKTMIPSNAQRRSWRSWRVVHDAGEQQEHQQHRELERDTEREEHQRDQRQVLVGGDERLDLAADASR